MKLEISYKNSLIGSLSAGESLALHLNGSKLTEDLIVRAVGGNFTVEDNEQGLTVAFANYTTQDNANGTTVIIS